MAQASSAQREPSMEEILASIRRIIEDSDTVRKGVHEDELQDDAESPGTESAVVEVNAFRSELHAPRSAPTEQFEPQPEAVTPEPAKPVTLAEVQARIAAETEDGQAEAQADMAEPMTDVAQPFEAQAPVRPDFQQPAEPSVTPVAAPEWSEQEEEEHAAMPRAEAAEAAQAPSAPEAEHDAGAPAQTEPLAVLRPSIISEQAGRQVAAAFGELSEAFAARSRKTFDDMAEQMMRPMLQDWLDNNLPTLVERLVREEIERVARGG